MDSKINVLQSGLSDPSLQLVHDQARADRHSGSTLLSQQQLDSFLAGVQAKAFRMARLATGNNEDALDIVQEAMLKLVEKYGHKPAAELGPLFHCILQSRIRDWYRRHAVRKRVLGWLPGADADQDGAESADPMQQVPDPGGRSGEDALQAASSIEALNRALAALPLRQQQAFLLRAWEGLDVRQTATAMRCSEGSVKTHYSRALHTLQDRLGDHWQSSG